jgi:hypothetical protein
MGAKGRRATVTKPRPGEQIIDCRNNASTVFSRRGERRPSLFGAGSALAPRWSWQTGSRRGARFGASGLDPELREGLRTNLAPSS